MRDGMTGFNSRAREGRDRRYVVVVAATAGFNSRAREGRDVNALGVESFGIVSIHAPARGATRAMRPDGARYCFNSRAREGRDPQAVRCR